MLYKRSTVMCDDDWGHFIDMDDTPLNKKSRVLYAGEPYHATTTSFCIYNFLSETYLMACEIPIRTTINDSCICSAFVTTFTLGSIMLCFIL